MNICAVPVPSNASSSIAFDQPFTLSALLSTPSGVGGEYELVPSRICGEHGTCVASPERADDFACVCAAGFTGRYCHISKSP